MRGAAEDQRSKEPFRNSEEIGRALHAEDRLHPGDERIVGEEGNEALNFIVEPLLISEEEIDDGHRCAEKVVIEILSEKPELIEIVNEQIHEGSFWHAPRVDPGQAVSSAAARFCAGVTATDGVVEKRGWRPSVMVGCARMASRSAV